MKLSKNVQTTLSEFIRAAANLKNITDEAEKQLTDSEKKKVAFENALELAKDEYSKLKRKIGNYELEFNEKKTLAQKEVEEQKKQASILLKDAETKNAEAQILQQEWIKKNASISGKQSELKKLIQEVEEKKENIKAVLQSNS